MGAIIWLSAQDVLHNFRTGSEQQYLEQFLLDKGNKLQELSEQSWGIKPNQSVKQEQPEIELPSVKKTEIDGSVLANKFLMAAQHTGWKNSSNDIGDNPHTPNNQYWAKVFSEKAGNEISSTINSAFTKQAKATNVALARLDEYFKNMAIFLEEVSKAAMSNSKAMHRRTDLLWWKQSLYSKTLNRSYRNAKKTIAGLAMALDLLEMVPSIYPISVDYLLKETLRDVFGDEVDMPENISNLIDNALKLKAKEKEMLRTYTDNSDGIKLCLTGFANHLSQDIDADFYHQTGIAQTDKLSLSEFVVWMFHNMQAIKIAKSK